MPMSRATPTAMVSNEATSGRSGTTSGPHLDQELLAWQQLEPADGQTPQPSLAAIDPAERRTDPSAPVAE